MNGDRPRSAQLAARSKPPTSCVASRPPSTGTRRSARSPAPTLPWAARRCCSRTSSATKTPGAQSFLTSAIGSRRQIQLMLGLPEGTSDSAIVRHLRDAFKKPIPPRVVETGPVKENIVEGDDIDLFEFPAPKWHAD